MTSDTVTFSAGTKFSGQNAADEGAPHLAAADNTYLLILQHFVYFPPTITF